MKKTLIIATRKSQLALWQANHVKQLLLEKNPQLNIEFCELTSEGDEKKDVPLQNIGGKGLFVKTIQNAVIDQRADIAVHSLKDLSVIEHEQLTLAAFIKRGDARDVLVSFNYKSLADLPENAVIGTASPRRECLLKSLRPDIQTKLLRGNVETRIKKCEAGEYDAIILAAAGLTRLGLEKYITEYLNYEDFIPAIGQGIIVAECRRDDRETQALLREINHHDTEICAHAERAFNQELGGDCFTPLGAFATINDELLTIIGFQGDINGANVRSAQEAGQISKAKQLGRSLAKLTSN